MRYGPVLGVGALCLLGTAASLLVPAGLRVSTANDAAPVRLPSEEPSAQATNARNAAPLRWSNDVSDVDLPVTVTVLNASCEEGTGAQRVCRLMVSVTNITDEMLRVVTIRPLAAGEPIGGGAVLRAVDIPAGRAQMSVVVIPLHESEVIERETLGFEVVAISR